MIGGGRVATVQNCGNILAGVLPFAIECGMWHPLDGETTATIQMVNSGGLCEIRKSGTVRTARLISKGEVYIPAGIWAD